MLRILDLFFSFLHIAFTLFNLVGWIWKRTRRIHLVTMGLTTASWFILGIWFGWGYCFLTDWQWDVKRKLGETNLPSSFIKYFVDKLFGGDISPSIVTRTTLICFLGAWIATLYVNFLMKRATKSGA